jgi:hypothetical protein
LLKKSLKSRLGQPDCCSIVAKGTGLELVEKRCLIVELQVVLSVFAFSREMADAELD